LFWNFIYLYYSNLPLVVFNVDSFKASEKEKEPAYDYEQDSSDGSVEIFARGAKTKKDKGFAKIDKFFYPLTWKEGNPKGFNLNYKC
jgi:hypothetical protein